MANTPLSKRGKVLIQFKDADGVHEVGSVVELQLPTKNDERGFEVLVNYGVIEALPDETPSSKNTSKAK